MRPRTASRSFALLLALGAVLAAPTAGVARERCDPAGADASRVAAARRAADTACPCDGFSRHEQHVRCTRRLVKERVGAGELSRTCAAEVMRLLRRSSCSFTLPHAVCCERASGNASDTCRIRRADLCVTTSSRERSACASARFCADTRCGAELAAPRRSCDVPELLYSAEGNRLRRFDLDSVKQPPLVEDVLIETADVDPAGRDINGQICAFPDASGRFVSGEDTGQPHPPAGWGVFAADGTQVGKLAATYFVRGAEPFGCAFDREGRLFTTEVGHQASGAFDGQLILWFPPYDRFPGPPGAYPATDARSDHFCKIATDIGTATSVAVDDEGRVYVAAARAGVVYRFSPPFPTAPDAAGGCGATDALGSPVATAVQREVFIPGGGTFSGIARGEGGSWYVASVFTGTIGEYDANGVLLRTIVAPAPGEAQLPLSVGHPQGLARDCAGDLYYADLDLVLSGGSIEPGANGKVRRVAFDVCGQPGTPEIVKEGLAFPDGLGILPGNLEGP